jgi:hypothetical protein
VKVPGAHTFVCEWWRNGEGEEVNTYKLSELEFLDLLGKLLAECPMLFFLLNQTAFLLLDQVL